MKIYYENTVSGTRLGERLRVQLWLLDVTMSQRSRGRDGNEYLIVYIYRSLERFVLEFENHQ
jgi:hypothetical protein